MLQYLGSQRVGHDIVPEQQQLQTRGEIKKKEKKKVRKNNMLYIV